MAVDEIMRPARARTLAFGLAVVVASLAGPLLVAKPAHAATFSVNSAADPGTGECDVTECTLREAISAANANDNEPAGDLISFAIPGAGPHIISPESDLPAITERVTIDGYSQTGASPATDTTNAVLRIEIDGTNLGEGLRIHASNSVVKGLVINGFSNRGVWIAGSGATGNRVEGNYIGTDVTGAADLGNLYGVYLESFANTVGGTAAAERNTISGNTIGVFIALSQATGNRVVGNHVGTTADGTVALGNNIGFVINGATANTVGGTTAAERNTISGNSGDGVFITSSSTTDNQVLGNYIGTTADGAEALGNGGAGVRIDNLATRNTVGGTQAGARNVISANGGDGVVIGDILGADASGNQVVGNYIGTDASGTQPLGNAGNGVAVRGSASTGNRILSNSILSNTDLGIDLQGGNEDANGITRNDPGDPDKGANNRQNFPVLASAATDGATTTITGRLNSRPNKTFTIQVFGSAVADPSGNGEGERLLGQKDVKTNDAGKRTFTFTVNEDLSGRVITATATRVSTGDTSEFSRALPVN